MNFLGRNLSSIDCCLVCSGLMALRPMTAEEVDAEKKRRQEEIRNINSHPVRYLLKLSLAVVLLIFSIWLFLLNLKKSL